MSKPDLFDVFAKLPAHLELTLSTDISSGNAQYCAALYESAPDGGWASEGARARAVRGDPSWRIPPPDSAVDRPAYRSMVLTSSLAELRTMALTMLTNELGEDRFHRYPPVEADAPLAREPAMTTLQLYKILATLPTHVEVQFGSEVSEDGERFFLVSIVEHAPEGGWKSQGARARALKGSPAWRAETHEADRYTDAPRVSVTASDLPTLHKLAVDMLAHVGDRFDLYPPVEEDAANGIVTRHATVTRRS